MKTPPKKDRIDEWAEGLRPTPMTTDHTETPKVDAKEKFITTRFGTIIRYVDIEDARQLEKELTQARAALATAMEERDEARKKQPINTSLRLFDLVRFMRSDLLGEKLITEEEYSWLAHESPMATSPKGGSPSRERLEDYDDLREELSTLRSTLRQAAGN